MLENRETSPIKPILRFCKLTKQRAILSRNLSSITIAFLLSTAPTLNATTYRIDDLLPKGLNKPGTALVENTIISAASNLKQGDALVLSNKNTFETVKMPSLPKNVQIIGGIGKKMFLTGDLRGISIFGAEYELDTRTYNAKLLDSSFIILSVGDKNFGDAESTYIISNIGAINAVGNWKNVTGLWIRYNHEHKREAQPSLQFDLKGTGQNCKILCAIEHNQGNEKPAVLIQNADGFAMAHGSTESSSSYEGRPLYELKNCLNTYLGHRRFYSGRGPFPKTDLTQFSQGFFIGCRQVPTCWQNWYKDSVNKWLPKCRYNSTCWKGWPIRSLKVSGGSNNILDNIVDLGDPMKFSFEIEDKSIQMWSLIGEAELSLPAEKTKISMLSVTPQCAASRDYSKDTWTEPRDISAEIPFGIHLNNQFYDLSKLGTQLPVGSWPTPPSYPKCEIPKLPTMLHAKVANFGSALISAGADPTGIRPSDSAFSKVAQEQGIIEVPAGIFRIEKGINYPTSAGRGQLLILGAGEKSTRLIGLGQATLIPPTPPLKTAVETVTFCDLTFDGRSQSDTTSGNTEIQDYATSKIKMRDVFYNCTFQNYKKAAIINNTNETEQYRFISCKFINTGEYGIRLDAYSDKPLFYDCYFKGQSKGGIYCTRIVHFHGGIYQCSFDSIGGPAVKIGGGNMVKGYGPWVFTVDNCTFNECGNNSEAIVDFGYSWESVLTNSTFKTSRPVFGAFKGNFAILENLNINVNSATSLYLGHQRYEGTVGVGNARLNNVTSNGQIKFLSRLEAMSDDPNYTTNNRFYTCGGDLYDSNEWAYTYLFYNVYSSNINEKYSLYKGSTKFLDLSTISSIRPGNSAGAKLNLQSKKVIMYNLAGKLVARIDANKPLPKGIKNNILIIRDQNLNKIVKRVMIGN